MTYCNVLYTDCRIFVENKTAIEINNLIVADWLNILCKYGDVK